MTCTLIEPEAGLLVLLRQDFERDDGFNLAVEILQWAPADVPAGPAHPAAGRGDLLVVPLGSSFLRMLNQSGQETKAREVEQVIGQQLCSSTVPLGGDPAIDLVGLSIDWQKNLPLIRALAAVCALRAGVRT